MQPNRALYQEFPPELRNAYGDAVKAREWSSRHKGLLDFAEAALGYLASLSLSDYRTRSSELAGNVELVIEKFREKPLTMGRLLDLLRASATAMADPIVPSAELPTDAQRDGMRRFLAAIAAIEAAMEGLSPAAPPSALNVAHYVENAQLGTMEQADWWDGWSRLINYRTASRTPPVPTVGPLAATVTGRRWGRYCTRRSLRCWPTTRWSRPC